MARVIILTLDSVGIGEMPDAHLYGDAGANTIVNTARRTQGLRVPNLRHFGLGNITPIAGVPPVTNPHTCFGKMAEISPGKDTVTGHWELAGIHLKHAFPTYPDGFPEDIMEEFTKITGLGYLGNIPASGTEIIKELGDEHMATGKPIIYTSADSVFQIAAHEDVISPNELYDICTAVHGMLVSKNAIARVIARPFTKIDGIYTRTFKRKDFTILPPAGNLWDEVKKLGLTTVSIGKINDIFGGQNIDFSYQTKNNDEVVENVLRAMAYHKEGLIWANLVDFDTLYGHRNDYKGYAKALERLDLMLPRIHGALKEDDMLIITADHGADPTTSGTNHTREYVPLLILGKKLNKGIDLGVRTSFSDVGQTAIEFLGGEPLKHGVSMFNTLVKSDEKICRHKVNKTYLDLFL